MTVGVLEAGSGRLIHHREDMPAGAPEGLEGKETLSRPCVSRHANERFERLGIGQRCNRGVGTQLVRNVGQKTGEHLEDRNAVVA